MKKILSFLLAVTAILAVHAQGFTTKHDATKMNQFLMQEIGTGSFQSKSEWYYDVTHRSYKKSLLSTNKSFFRTAAYEASFQQVGYADSIKSRLEARAKEETINMADRQLDVAWLIEQSKIENALTNYKNNVSLLSINGASSEEKDDWQQYANMYDFAITRTRNAYMANSERQKEYLTIYDDIVTRNNKLVRRLRYLKALKGTDEMLSATSNPRPSRVLQCASQSYTKWREAGMSVRTGNRNH